MKAIRYPAAIATIVMSLLNLPIALDDNGIGLPAAVAWLISLLGVAGIVAAVGLFRSAAWATQATVAIGVLNLAGAVIALVKNWDGAIIGLAVSSVAAVLSIAHAASRSTAIAQKAS
jgi:hypothetical protein